jgi:hypothetical protein
MVKNDIPAPLLKNQGFTVTVINSEPLFPAKSYAFTKTVCKPPLPYVVVSHEYR